MEENNEGMGMLRKYAVPVAVLALVVAIGGWAIGTFNSLTSMRVGVESDWAQVENVMQRRCDLIPNLVASVKGEMQNEQEIFGSIAESRKQFQESDSPADKLKADEELSRQTTILVNAVKESYPDLASSEQVKSLMVQLEGSENRISTERRRYIEAVAKYDRALAMFPANVLAGPMGFEKIDQFKASDAAQDVPAVSFD